VLVGLSVWSEMPLLVQLMPLPSPIIGTQTDTETDSAMCDICRIKPHRRHLFSFVPNIIRDASVSLQMRDKNDIKSSGWFSLVGVNALSCLRCFNTRSSVWRVKNWCQLLPIVLFWGSAPSRNNAVKQRMDAAVILQYRPGKNLAVCVYLIIDSTASGKYIFFRAAAFSIWEGLNKA